MGEQEREEGDEEEAEAEVQEGGIHSGRVTSGEDEYMQWNIIIIRYHVSLYFLHTFKVSNVVRSRFESLFRSDFDEEWIIPRYLDGKSVDSNDVWIRGDSDQIGNAR